MKLKVASTSVEGISVLTATRSRTDVSAPKCPRDAGATMSSSSPGQVAFTAVAPGLSVVASVPGPSWNSR